MSRVSSDKSILSLHTFKGESSHDSNDDLPISKVQTAGTGEELIIIGNQKFYRHELMSAFGGTMNPGLAPYPKHSFGNASALGLSSVGMTTLISGFYGAGVMGIEVPNLVVGVALFGGVTQFAAGIWEGILGNTFAMTAICSYGAFWLQYAVIYVYAFGIGLAYYETGQMANALGLNLLAWAIFSFMLLICTLKSTVALVSLFTAMTLSFVFNSAACFTGHAGLAKAGGVFSILTGFLAFYNAYAGVATKENTYILAGDIRMPNSMF